VASTGLGVPPRSGLGGLWALDPAVCYLNHGSFGACLLEILEYRRGLVEELEAEPMDFLVRELPGRLADQISFMESFLDAEPGSIVLVPNATTGVNTILRSLRFDPGDEILVTTTEYFSTRNASLFHAASTGASVRLACLPFPLGDPSEATDAILSAVTPRTRLAVIDHISSQTAVVFDVAGLTAELGAKGVDVLVDGAHGPGSVPLSLRSIGAPYYTGNCHKWLCSPKVCAILYVRPDLQKQVHPLAISHLRPDLDSPLSDFQLEFMWNGTPDPTPALSVKKSVEAVGSLVPGGWPEIMDRNRRLAMEAGRKLSSALGLPPQCPDSMHGSMSAVCLPWVEPPSPPGVLWLDPLQVWLREKRSIEIPMTWTSQPKRRILRLSAHLYNSPEEFDYLVESVLECPRLTR
jgi:isopenicillin-N epimerase